MHRDQFQHMQIVQYYMAIEKGIIGLKISFYRAESNHTASPWTLVSVP